MNFDKTNPEREEYIEMLISIKIFFCVFWESMSHMTDKRYRLLDSPSPSPRHIHRPA